MQKKVYLLCLRDKESREIKSVLAAYSSIKKAQVDLSKGFLNILPSDEYFIADCSLY